MYKFCYFVPESHLEQTKQALFDVGAGKIGEYDSCAWQEDGPWLRMFRNARKWFG